MIRDLERERPEQMAADVCLVGAGAAGILLAVELVRMGKSVLLLEGGGAEIEEPSQDPYRSEVVGVRHQGIHTGRFRAKGGTTTRWGGQILEFDELDFAVRDWVPGSGWPFAKSELSPYYARALEQEGLGGVLREDAAVWAGLGVAGPHFAGLDGYFSRWTPEPNFARVHGEKLANGIGITVWLHANVVELVLDGERAAGVRCRTLGGVEAVFTASEYVFCLGAIESSRFFLQPRQGGLPWNESGLLGRHFQDHIDSNAAVVRPLEVGKFHALFDNVFLRGLKYHPKLRLAKQIQAAEQTLNVAATMHFESDADEVLGGIKTTAKHLLCGRFGEVKATDLANVVANLPALVKQTYRYGVQHRAYVPADAKISLRVHCEQEPLSASSITLSDERDGLGMLRTRLDWRISDVELATIRRYVEVAAGALAGVAALEMDGALAAGSREYVARCDDSNHHMGGMRMGASARTGVVDADLRLHGVKNVYIGSSAVFPTSGYSNPTHTLLALVMRLAAHLR